MMTIMVKKPKSSVSTRTKLRVTAVPGRSPMMMLLIAAFGLCVQAAYLRDLSEKKRHKKIRGYRLEQGTYGKEERIDDWNWKGIGTLCKRKTSQWDPQLDFNSIDRHLQRIFKQDPFNGNLRLTEPKDYVGSGVYKVSYGAIASPKGGWCFTPQPQQSEKFVVKFGWKGDGKTKVSFDEERHTYETVKNFGLTKDFLAKTWFHEFKNYVVWIQPRMDESLRSYMVNKYTPEFNGKKLPAKAVKEMTEELSGILDGFWDKAKQCGIFIADLHQDNVRRVKGGVWHVTDFQFEQNQNGKGFVTKEEQLRRWVSNNITDMVEEKVYK